MTSFVSAVVPNPERDPEPLKAWGPVHWCHDPSPLAGRPSVRSGLCSLPHRTWREGRPGQCAAFRPGGCDILPATGAPGARVTAWSCCWRARHKGGTAGTAGGRSPGEPCAAAAAPVGLPPGRARAKLPPRNGASPGEPQPPTAGHPGRFTLSPGCSRSSSLLTAWPSGPARRRCALETVEKVVTARYRLDTLPDELPDERARSRSARSAMLTMIASAPASTRWSESREVLA